ncbi:hypothetical protein BURKHO8Y_120042 [Burkholderia sp. 8Y]|nr:hypothetical protein BURKHO8Y_120042 [Burkholderia sp. 8Y]
MRRRHRWSRADDRPPVSSNSRPTPHAPPRDEAQMRKPLADAMAAHPNLSKNQQAKRFSPRVTAMLASR